MTKNPVIFDTWLNGYEPGEQTEGDPSVASMICPSDRWSKGCSIEELIADMDQAGYAGGVHTKMNYVVREPLLPGLLSHGCN